MTTNHAEASTRSGATTARIFVAWALVGIPLIYGIAMTLTRVAALFAG